MSGTKHLEEGEVAAVLDLAILVAIVERDVLDISLVEILLTRPLKSISPGLVTEPVTDEVSVASVDQYWNLLKDTWHKTVEGLHPVALEKEVTVDVKVATVIAADFNAELLLNGFLIQVLADPAKGRIAEVVGVFALTTDVVDILSSSLVRTEHSIVAVDARWNARPNALAIVAVLNETLATGKSIFHSLALAVVENSWVTTLSTCHWLIVLVLGKTISKTITNEDGLEIDVAFLVRENLGSENWNVVARI